jgi:hypothetical protein
MNRPETTNLNHQYAIRRVDMDLSSDAGIDPDATTHSAAAGKPV